MSMPDVLDLSAAWIGWTVMLTIAMIYAVVACCKLSSYVQRLVLWLLNKLSRKSPGSDGPAGCSDDAPAVNAHDCNDSREGCDCGGDRCKGEGQTLASVQVFRFLTRVHIRYCSSCRDHCNHSGYIMHKNDVPICAYYCLACGSRVIGPIEDIDAD